MLVPLIIAICSISIFIAYNIVMLTWTLRKNDISSQPMHREFTDEEYYMMRSCVCWWYNFQWVNYRTDEEVANLYGEETGDWDFEHIEEVYMEINKERRLREEFEEFKKQREGLL